MASKTISTVGRRKTSNARVLATAASDSFDTAKFPGAAKAVAAGESVEQIIVNGRYFSDYFPRKTAQLQILRPLQLTERIGRFRFRITVSGGGKSGQMGAVVHGMSRSLEKLEPELRSVLKKAGLLTRDPRAVERKKAGLHKARKRPQFSKR